MRKFTQSEKLFREAQEILPGGVDSPVRAYKAVGGTPPFIARARGCKLYDADGNEFIDFVGSWGPQILGHAYWPVTEALKKAVQNGTSYGAPTELETILAKMVRDVMPSMEMLRFVNSGTEATMSALRLARAFTKRDKIIKFEGCYHGHSDGLLIKGGSGLATLGTPDSPGVPASYAQNTVSARYNDLNDVEHVFHTYPDQIAAIIVEPVAANMGVIPPADGFLAGLRTLADKNGALLVFDEVITGFRVARGGAQGLYGVKPDLTCLGKIIGGGLPVGAYGGRRDLMEMIAPVGPVYQAGTLSGNPLAMTAGIETLKALQQQPDVYKTLETRAAGLEKGIVATFASSPFNAQVKRVASILTVFFTSQPLSDWDSVKGSDTVLFGRFFHALLDEGIYWPPSQFEAVFVSLAHSELEIHATLTAIKKAIATL